MPADSANSTSVPALERGLSVLEHLAVHPEPATLSEIARICGLTVATVQRTVACLHATGYLIREADGGYLISSRLFRVAHQYPPYRDLLSMALPHMHRFAARTEESVHLAVLVFDEMMIIGQAEADAPVRLTVKVGLTHDALSTLSGLLLVADLPVNDRLALFRRRKLPRPQKEKLLRELARIKEEGMGFRPSSVKKGIWDLGVPIRLEAGRAVAALTTGYLEPTHTVQKRPELIAALKKCASEIAHAHGLGHYSR